MPAAICVKCAADINPRWPNWVDRDGQEAGADGHLHMPKLLGWKEQWDRRLDAARDEVGMLRAHADELDAMVEAGWEQARQSKFHLQHAASTLERLTNLIDAMLTANRYLVRQNALLGIQIRLDRAAADPAQGGGVSGPPLGEVYGEH